MQEQTTMNGNSDVTYLPGVGRQNNHNYTYRETLVASRKVNWEIEDIIGGDKQLDFTKPFMPESLARVEGLTFLTPDERRVLNQIRGHDYLYLFGAVEEFIVPFVLDHIRPELHGDDYRVRATLQFAGEEAKHIHLFKRFCEEFVKGFGSKCEVIGPPAEIAKAVLAHHPLAVGLAILQIEWMTQRHYIESVMDDQDLDPQFKSLLKHHWLEEAQHTKLDTLIIEELVEPYSDEEIEAGIEDYLKIGAFLDAGLMQQVEFDLENFTRATGRELTRAEREEFISSQRKGNRWTYLGSGMTHKNFLRTLERLKPGAGKRIEEIAKAFC